MGAGQGDFNTINIGLNDQMKDRASFLQLLRTYDGREIANPSTLLNQEFSSAGSIFNSRRATSVNATMFAWMRMMTVIPMNICKKGFQDYCNASRADEAGDPPTTGVVSLSDIPSFKEMTIEVTASICRKASSSASPNTITAFSNSLGDFTFEIVPIKTEGFNDRGAAGISALTLDAIGGTLIPPVEIARTIELMRNSTSVVAKVKRKDCDVCGYSIIPLINTSSLGNFGAGDFYVQIHIHLTWSGYPNNAILTSTPSGKESFNIDRSFVIINPISVYNDGVNVRHDLIPGTGLGVNIFNQIMGLSSSPKEFFINPFMIKKVDALGYVDKKISSLLIPDLISYSYPDPPVNSLSYQNSLYNNFINGYSFNPVSTFLVLSGW